MEDKEIVCLGEIVGKDLENDYTKVDSLKLLKSIPVNGEEVEELEMRTGMSISLFEMLIGDFVHCEPKEMMEQLGHAADDWGMTVPQAAEYMARLWRCWTKCK